MHVLLIEDDPSNIELLSLRLEALDCTVESVDTADAGLARARAGGHDAIVVDLKLENDLTKGVALVRALKAAPEVAGVPVVIHSVFVAHPTDAPEGLPVAEGYLPKPFRMQELRELMERLRAARDGAGRRD